MNIIKLQDLTITLDQEVPTDFIGGVVYVRNCSKGVANQLMEKCNTWYESWQQNQFATDERVKTELRNLLRARGYIPSGRGKPASEYLLRWFQSEERFVSINPAVDVNNLISVKYLLPASILDVNLLDSKNLTLRLGKPDESYVFNSSGQEINLKGLVLISDSTPAGNPIKDSMRAKLTDDSKDMIAVLYCSKKAYDVEETKKITAEFADLLYLALTPTEVFWNVLFSE